MIIKSKLPDVGQTIFTVMSKMATDHNAINLSQGFPDFDVNPKLVSLVNKYMEKGLNQYAPMQGVPILRRKISDKTLELYGRRYNPDNEITITSGATEALFAAITAVVDQGDEALILEPAYDSYLPAVLLSKGAPVFVKMKHPDYHIDWNEVNDAVNEKTRLIIINTPHNPTGMALQKEDIDNLTTIVRDRNLFILSDEVYEHIIFDGATHHSVARYPELAEKSFVVSSFGKTYHTTGWKLGYCLAPEPLTKEFQRIHQFLTFASNHPMQLAYADIMDDADFYLDLPSFYQKKRDLFLKLIEPSRLKPLPCKGTYFQMVDYSAITDEDDVGFSRRLTVEHKVAAIPPSVFYSDHDDHRALRLCFAKKDQTLERAGELLCRI